jgi:hypothetical protein
MKTMKLLTLSLAVTFTAASLAHAGNLALKQSTSEARIGGTSGVGGGGDDVGLDFQASAARALQNLKIDLIDSETQQRALEMLQSAQFLVSDKPLQVIERNGSTQSPVAVNIPTDKIIYIDAKKWKALGNEEVRQSLALHEVFSLMGLEKNGDYSISSQFKNSQMGAVVLATANSVASMNQVQVENYQRKLFAELRTGNSKRTPYEILKELYDTAPVGAQLKDIPVCDVLAATKNRKPFYLSSYEARVNTTTAEFTSYTQQQGRQYMARYEVNWVTKGTPSAGPLFPGTPDSEKRWFEPGKFASEATSCQKVNAVDVWDFSGTSDEVQVESLAGKTIETKSDLIMMSELTLPRKLRERLKVGVLQRKMYFRKSGNLIAVKVITQNSRKDSTLYFYGWKE